MKGDGEGEASCDDTGPLLVVLEEFETELEREIKLGNGGWVGEGGVGVMP